MQMGWHGADRHGMRCDEQAQAAAVDELIIPTSAQLNSFQARASRPACHIVVDYLLLIKVPYHSCRALDGLPTTADIPNPTKQTGLE